MAMITLTIDDIEVTVPEGATILDAAQQAEIYIPHLCSHPDLPVVEAIKPADIIYRNRKPFENKKPDLEYEGCQLCVVEIEGTEDLQRACNTTVTKGMVVHTSTPELQKSRQDKIMVLLAKHPHACLTCAQKEGCARFPCSMNIPEKERCCPKFGNCEFQSLVEYVGIKPETPRYLFEDIPIEDEPLFERDYNVCIGCTRCIRICRDVRGIEAIDFVFDEEDRVMVGSVAPTLRESACRFCTACVEVCPTGALTDKKPYEEVPCASACPAGIDVPNYVRLIAEGKYDESYAVVREKLPLPSVCGYVCLSYCEAECRRSEVNEAVGIRELKKFVSVNHTDLWKKNIKKSKATRKKVAILGSGPAGLTAAYYLVRKGHGVTVFEQAPLPGGMLRQAISRKRLPKKALEDDISEIIKAGVKLELNSDLSISELLENGYDTVFLAIGSTFVGAAAYYLKDEGIKITPWGNIEVDSRTLATSREGIFAGGDAILGNISQDFISYAQKESSSNFFKLLIDDIAKNRGDTSRSAIRAIASGRKAAEAIDRFLGGDGDITESLLPAEEPVQYLGRVEGFADIERFVAPYHPPVPQYAGLIRVEPSLYPEVARAEAGRCLRCDLRLLFSKPVMAPKEELWTEFNKENVREVPEIEGVYQLLNEEKNIIYIKGTMNLQRELLEQLELRENACYFMFEEEPMYTKRESELLQQYMAKFSEMPEGNRELDDLF